MFWVPIPSSEFDLRVPIPSLGHTNGFLGYPIGSMYGIYTYIYHKYQLNLGKYASPMDPMGIVICPRSMFDPAIHRCRRPVAIVHPFWAYASEQKLLVILLS